MQDKQVSKYFHLSEYFINHLQCMDEKLIKPKLIELVQEIRDTAGVPITITSGWRSIQKNQQVGGALKSEHLNGAAVDITSRQISIDKLYEICKANSKVIGLGDGRKYGFVHVDIRTGKRVEWKY